MPRLTPRAFRLLSFIEATSFLLLLFVAMPLKYWAGIPLAVTIVGAAHGWIFVAYLGIVIWAARTFSWKPLTIVGAVLASILPFGPFVFDAWKPRVEPNSPSRDA